MFKGVFTVFFALGNVLGVSYMEYAEKFAKLLEKKEVSAFAEYFNASIQLSTPSKDGVYSQAQASRILTEFLSDHNPVSCKAVSDGTSENGAQIAKLNLTANNGKYKVSVFYRKNGNTVKIHQVKIE